MDIEKSKLTSLLAHLVHKVYALTGFPIDDVNTTIQIAELQKDLSLYFKFLTIGEIDIAFQKGCKKEYGEYYGLSYVTYIGWVNAYKNSLDRSNAIKSIENAQKELLPKPKELTEEDKEQIIIDGSLKKFKDFKEFGRFEDFGNVTYNFLEKKGLINFTIERKKLIKEKVLKELRERSVYEKSVKDTIQKSIEVFMQEDKVVVECRKEALKQYFQDLLDIGCELII